MEKDVRAKQYLAVPERFADLINGVVCSGKNIITPADQELREDTYDMIAEYTDTVELMEIKKFKEEGEKINMCRAITELIQDGRVEELIGTSRELGSTWEATLERLIRRLKLSTEAAEEYMKKYWHS